MLHESFSSDGNWLLYSGKDAAGKNGLFRVATPGGQPERLGDFPGLDTRSLWISPDGKALLADSGNPLELWSLENFEPKQQAAK
jgi:Tol biopolymer transport system component